MFSPIVDPSLGQSWYNFKVDDRAAVNVQVEVQVNVINVKVEIQR
jgi:hypothetical protein